MSQRLHSALRVRQNGALVIVQPWDGARVAGDSLTVDLATGALKLADYARLESNYFDAFGVAGLVPLLGSHALVLVTAGTQVARLREALVWKLKESTVLHDVDGTHSQYADVAQYLKLLRDAFNGAGSGRGLHFSFDVDVTQTQQRAAKLAADAGAAAKPLHATAESRFFWNQKLLQPLIDGGAGQFAMPMMLASIHQLPAASLGDGSTATITLIARRAVHRVGTRHWRRGADPEGNVANFVETEQLVEVEGPKGAAVSSYVQVRGSIPILWSQKPNLKYKPTTRVAPPEVYGLACQRHIRRLLDIYQEVDAVNLVNQHGSELVLSKAFEEQAAAFAKTGSGFRLITFDFHKQCGATSYHNLAKLWAQLKDDWERFGYFYQPADGVPAVQQTGVMRVNCIDCLDRTNVVQGLLGRKHLEATLAQAGLLPPGATLETAFPAVHQAFRVVWADHGDDISRQYAGTGALKSGFTRTGKRTTMGLLDDGVKSVTRYYLNTFQDGQKQDALDLASGSYRVESGKGSPFKPQRSALVPLAAAAVSVIWGILVMIRLILGYQKATLLGAAQMVVLPVLLGVVLFRSTMKNGSELVTKPQLRPDLVQPWD